MDQGGNLYMAGSGKRLKTDHHDRIMRKNVPKVIYLSGIVTIIYV